MHSGIMLIQNVYRLDHKGAKINGNIRTNKHIQSHTDTQLH